MPIIQHFFKFNFNPGSYEPFRYEAHCQCGFTSRNAREELALSQAEAHLQYWGIDLTKKSDKDIPRLAWEKYSHGLPCTQLEQKYVDAKLKEDEEAMYKANHPEQSSPTSQA